MNEKAPFMISAQSSGSSCSAIAVDRATSAKRIVANLRSPSTDRGFSSGLPQLLQNFAVSGLAEPQFGHVSIEVESSFASRVRPTVTPCGQCSNARIEAISGAYRPELAIV